METVTFTYARNNLKKVLDKVVDDFAPTIVNRRDSHNAVIMSLEHYNSIMETLHFLRSPANVSHLEKSIAQFEAGKVVERGLVED